MTTIYKQLIESGIAFTNKDCGIIGEAVKAAYFARVGVLPAKVKQREGEYTFSVFEYADEFAGEIKEQIEKHFTAVHKPLDAVKIEKIVKQKVVLGKNISIKKGKRTRIFKTKIKLWQQ